MEDDVQKNIKNPISDNFSQDNFESLLVLIANQQIQLNNLTQIINMQSQLMNEVKIDLNRFLLKIMDMEIRNNINEENISDIGSNINQLIDGNSEIKSAIDNIKVYQLPDNYFT